jgi:hypothetical protein
MSRTSAKFCVGKAPLIVSVAVVLFGPCFGAGQVPATAPAPSPSSVQNEAPLLVAKFEGTLNTKSAKVGDVIAAKTAKDLKLKDLDIPKGSKLVGTVASVQSMQAGGGTSSLAIKFDHVELKSGAFLRIQGLIVSIGPAPELKVGLGYNSVLNRGGAGATPELDPSIASDHYGQDSSDLPKGSTLEGVALGLHLNSAGATDMRGVHRDIKLDLGVMIKVALYRPTSG